MPKQSAGVLVYRYTGEQLEIFLVHPGGPFFVRRDLGVWSVPKGEFLNDEDPLAAAKREFEEETGQTISGEFIELTPVKQKGGKTVYCWAVAGDVDHENIHSNVFPLEYPPRSGKYITIPEVDKGSWFDTETAKTKIIPAQVALIEELEEMESKK